MSQQKSSQFQKIIKDLYQAENSLITKANTKSINPRDSLSNSINMDSFLRSQQTKSAGKVFRDQHTDQSCYSDKVSNPSPLEVCRENTDPNSSLFFERQSSGLYQKSNNKVKLQEICKRLTKVKQECGIKLAQVDFESLKIKEHKLGLHNILMRELEVALINDEDQIRTQINYLKKLIETSQQAQIEIESLYDTNHFIKQEEVDQALQVIEEIERQNTKAKQLGLDLLSQNFKIISNKQYQELQSRALEVKQKDMIDSQLSSNQIFKTDQKVSQALTIQLELNKFYMNELKDQVKQYQDSYLNEQKENHYLQEKIAQLMQNQSRLQQLERDMNEVVQQHSSFKNRILEILQSNFISFSFDQKSNSSVEDTLIRIMETYKKQADIINDLKQKHKELLDKSIAQESRIMEDGQIDFLKGLIVELKNKIQSMSSEVNQLNKENDSLNEKFQDTITKNDDLTQKILQQKLQIQELISLQTQWEEQINKVKRENEELIIQKQSKEKEIQNLKCNYEEVVLMCETTTACLSSKDRESTIIKDQLNSTSQQYQKEIQAIKQSYETRQQKFMDNLKEQEQRHKDMLQEQQEQFQKQYENSKSQYEFLIQKFEKRIDLLKNENEILKNQSFQTQQNQSQKPPKINVQNAFQVQLPIRMNTQNNDNSPSEVNQNTSFFREVAKYSKELDEDSCTESQQHSQPGFLRKRVKQYKSQTSQEQDNSICFQNETIQSEITNFQNSQPKTNQKSSALHQTFSSNPFLLQPAEMREDGTQSEIQCDDIFPPFDHRVCLRCKKNDMIAPNFCKFQVVQRIEDAHSKSKSTWQVSKEHVYGTNLNWRQRDGGFQKTKSLSQYNSLNDRKEKYDSGMNTILQLVNFINDQDSSCQKYKKSYSNSRSRSKQRSKNSSFESLSISKNTSFHL